MSGRLNELSLLNTKLNRQVIGINKALTLLYSTDYQVNLFLLDS